MTDNDTSGLPEEEVEKLEQAAIEEERENTKYGSELPEKHRENDD